MVGLNFIIQTIGAFDDPNRVVRALTQQNADWAAFAKKTIRRKTNRRYVSHAGNNPVQLTGSRCRSGRLNLDLQIITQSLGKIGVFVERAN